MALTVGEIRKLPVTESFRLVSGASGLDRTIEHVNLLDFEYDTWEPDAKSSDGIFDERSIVVTSLLFAKDHPEKIIRVVRQLYMDGVSALAVKAVYYQKLPQEVIDFSNEKAMPIFLFDSEKNFSENVVVGLTMAIEENENIDGLEEKVSFLLQENLGKINRMELLEELFPGLSGSFYCFYFGFRDMQSGFSYHHKITKLRNKKEPGLLILPYQYGILATVFQNKTADRSILEELLELVNGRYVCGVSGIGNRKEDIINKIQESLYAYDFAREHDHEFCHFEEIGIWQVILPNQKNCWMKSYCEKITEQLKKYDADNNGELYDTVVCYVKNDCNINCTADALSLHKNTVRYRIGKAREILGMEEKESEFHTAIYLAVHFQMMQNSHL